MLVLEAALSIRSEIGRMPRLVHVGLVLAGAALLLDLAVHVGPSHQHHAGFRVEEHAAHLVGLIAMVAVLLGVVRTGIRRQRSRRLRAAPGGSRHAHR